jgi:hypothetical protein
MLRLSHATRTQKTSARIAMTPATTARMIMPKNMATMIAIAAKTPAIALAKGLTGPCVM